MRFMALGFILFTLLCTRVVAANNVVNVYAWAEEVPQAIIKQFEHETKIKVNYSAFESPEVMFAKIRTNKNTGYDIVEPGSLLVERMVRQNMLEKLDKALLPNFKNLNPFFLHLSYDPQSSYTVPFFWGITGIFINTDYYSVNEVKRWCDLFNKKYLNQLMLLDDAREVFAMSLILSGQSINNRDPKHIQEAYTLIKKLMPNVRLFNSDAVNSLLIDEDATIGMAWNGDLYRAWLENPKLAFIFPQDGFEIWVDNFVILENAPHRDNAYRFLNFLMRPDVAKEASLTTNYATSNLAAYKLMPDHVKNNPVLYPSPAVLKQAQLQVDVGNSATSLYEKYWELLKIGG